MLDLPLTVSSKSTAKSIAISVQLRLEIGSGEEVLLGIAF
jgi:hypothetical protein